MEKFSDNVENYIHSSRNDLKHLDAQLVHINGEILEYIQLKNMLETFKEQFKDEPLKTQMNVGGNFFMQAKCPSLEKIILNVGLNVYLELTIAEALKMVDLKVRVLTKHADVVRDESLKVRANIKLGLLCIAEKNQML